MKKKILTATVISVAIAAAVSLPVLAVQLTDGSEEPDPNAVISDVNEDAEETPAPEETEAPEEVVLPNVTDAVLTEDHVAYISGSAGYFRPKAVMTRAEFAAILAQLIEGKVENTTAYTDVSSRAWYADAAELTGSLGLFHNTTDKFKPFQDVTRAEVIWALMQFYPVEEVEDEGFSDVPETHFAYKEICYAHAMGFISGYGDGTFHPDAKISRAEAVTMINKVLGRSVDDDYVASATQIRCFKDVGISDWSYAQVTEASTTHEYEIEEDGTETWTSHTKTNSGILAGKYLINGWLYEYSGKKGNYLRSTTSGTFEYNEKGHYTSGSKELDAELRKVITAHYDYSKTQEENLRIFYEWTRDSFKYLRRSPYAFGAVDWWQQDCLNMLTTGYGNCYCYASTFYYLSRWIGYNSKIYSGTVGTKHSPHGWVEINFDGTDYIFDTELDMAYRAKGQYLNIFYKMGNTTRREWTYIR